MEVQIKIKEVQELIRVTKAEIKPLQKRRNNITGRVKKSNDFIKRTKEKIKAFKSDRKKSGSGIETAIFAVLKEVYDVRIQAYHGGSLTGKDIQKVMSNAEDICNMIAGILKRDRKDGCEYQPTAIDEMMKSFSDAFLLWDGAFSIASKVNPTPDDIKMYERYAKAAVYSHQALGCNITHKVHLMYKHVAHQMRTVAAGIGNKREDWVERLHQVTNQKRKQYHNTKDLAVRANAREGSLQQESNPGVCSYIDSMNSKVCRGKRKNLVTKEEERWKRRNVSRAGALERWEDMADTGAAI